MANTPAAPAIPSQTVVAQPNTTAQPTVNPQGIAAQQNNAAATTAATSTQPQQQSAVIAASQKTPGVIASATTPTGSTPSGQGLAPVATTFQALTGNTQASQDAASLAQMNKTQADNANAAALDAQKRQQQLASGIDPTTGSPVTSFFNQSTGAWQSSPTVIPAPVKATTNLVSSTLASAVTSAMSPSGVLTTDGIDSASAALGSAVKTAQATSLANMPPTDAVAQQYIDSLSTEAQRLYNMTQNPNLDPQQQALLAEQASIASQKAAAITNIQTKADQSYNDQVAANAEATGKMKVALATGGVTGSPLGLSILAGVEKNNSRALQDIKTSEQDAITKANEAYDQQNFQVVMEQLQLADTRRTQYNDLLDKQYSVHTQMQQQALQMQQAQQQAILTHQQIVSNGKTAAADTLSVYAKQGLDVSAIPQAVWDTAVADSGGTIDVAGAKAMYQGSLVDQKAKTAEAFNTNTAAFYQAAAQIKDPNAILYRPNPDGSFTSIKKSAVQTVPNYDTFQTTKGGKNYATYVNKDDPTAKPVEVLLGNVDPKTSYKDDAFGNTLAITDNGDGTFSTKKVLDMMGNPVAQQAVVSTVSQLDSSGQPYTQNSGAPAWTPPNGSIHERNGKPATECGEYINDLLGTHFPDSLSGKIAQCDKTIGTNENPVKVGDAIVTNEAVKTGHVAAIASIGQDKKGTYYMVTESNYKKNAQGQGLVETGRKIYANSAIIQGFGRGTKELATKDGPAAPSDNSMSWSVNAPVGSAVSTAIKNGTVQDITQVGTYKNGDSIYMASIKDNTTGTITNYSGIQASELRIGAAWDESQTPPPVGTSGNGGHVVDVRNADGSPIAPTGHSLSAEVAAGQTWGQYDFIPTTTQAQSRYNAILGQVTKGTITLDSALQRMKTDPILGQVKPETYLPDFQDASSIGQTAKSYKDLQTMNLQETIQSKQLTEARKIVPAAQFSADPTVKNYRTTVAIMPEITSLENRLSQSDYKVGDAPSDLRLLDSYVRMSTGGTVTEAQGAMIKDNQSPINKALNIKGSAEYGGFLTPESRKQIVDMAHSLQNEQKKSFDEVAGSYQSQLDSYFQGRGMQSPIDLTKIADINNFTGDVVGRTGETSAVAQGTQDTLDPANVQIGDTTTAPDGQTYTWDGSNWN